MSAAVLLKICSGILLTLSCRLGELFRTSLASLILYDHRLAIIHACHFVAANISYALARFCRFLIRLYLCPFVWCVLTPENVSACLLVE